MALRTRPVKMFCLGSTNSHSNNQLNLQAKCLHCRKGQLQCVLQLVDRCMRNSFPCLLVGLTGSLKSHSASEPWLQDEGGSRLAPDLWSGFEALVLQRSPQAMHVDTTARKKVCLEFGLQATQHWALGTAWQLFFLEVEKGHMWTWMWAQKCSAARCQMLFPHVSNKD